MSLLYPFRAFLEFVVAIQNTDFVHLVIFSFVLYTCVFCPLYTILHIKD